MKRFFSLAVVFAVALMAIVACEPESTPNNGQDDPNTENPDDPNNPDGPDGPDTPTEEAFVITVSEIATTSAWIKVEPKDQSMSYYFDIIPEEDYELNNGDVGTFFEDIVAYYQMVYPTIDLSAFLPNLLSVGEDADSVTGLEPNTTYYAYAVEVNPSTGEAGENMSVYKFTTLAGGNPADCTFSFNVRQIYSTEVEFTIVPSDESVAYWYAVSAVEGYPGDVALQNEVKAMIDQYAAENNMTLEEMIPRLVMRGPVDDTWFELERSTTYYIYAYAMDKEGNPEGPIYKETFTTLESDISDANIAVTYRIFNGDELYASDNTKFANTQGLAVLQCEAAPNEAAYYWLMMLAGGDLTDAEMYPDDATINAMLEGGGKFNQVVAHYYVNWDATVTLLSFAADYNMLYGPLNRELIVVSDDNCAPVSQYLDNQYADIMQSVVIAPVAADSVIDAKVENLFVDSYRASRIEM